MSRRDQMVTPKRAAIYVRAATKQQDRPVDDTQGVSLSTQRAACRVEAKRLGAVVAKDGEFADDPTTASTKTRPSLQRLRQRVSHGDIDYVIVYRLDRIGRNLAEFAAIRVQLEAAGCQLVSCTEPTADSVDNPPLARLLQTTSAAVAEYDSRQRSQRMREYHERRREASATSVKAAA